MKILKEKKLEESSFMVGERTLSDVYWLIKNSKKANSIVQRSLKGVDLFKALVALNIEALQGRYSHNPEAMSQGVEKYRTQNDSTSFVQKFKSLQCFMYQCSEAPADTEPLFKALENIQELTTLDFIEDTHEYDHAYWGD
jgi:hypothetical protein